MSTHLFRFRNQDDLSDARLTLRLASVAVQGLYGEAVARLEAQYTVDRGASAIQIDGASEAGQALLRVFTKMLLEEFGDDEFSISVVRTGAKSSEANDGGDS